MIIRNDDCTQLQHLLSVEQLHSFKVPKEEGLTGACPLRCYFRSRRWAPICADRHPRKPPQNDCLEHNTDTPTHPKKNRKRPGSRFPPLLVPLLPGCVQFPKASHGKRAHPALRCPFGPVNDRACQTAPRAHSDSTQRRFVLRHNYNDDTVPWRCSRRPEMTNTSASDEDWQCQHHPQRDTSVAVDTSGWLSPQQRPSACMCRY